MALQNTYNGITYGAGVGSVVPGVGTIIGATAGGIVGFVSSLFGSDNVANNNFIDGLVAYSQSVGVQGMTHEDVVHLMPGGWGSNYNAASQQFLIYLQNASKYPNTDVSRMPQVLNFGGGYVANHSIMYVPSTAIASLSNTTPPTGNALGTSGSTIYQPGSLLNTAGFSPILIILLVGAGLFIFMSYTKK